MSFKNSDGRVFALHDGKLITRVRDQPQYLKCFIPYWMLLITDQLKMRNNHRSKFTLFNVLNIQSKIANQVFLGVEQESFGFFNSLISILTFLGHRMGLNWSHQWTNIENGKEKFNVILLFHYLGLNYPGKFQKKHIKLFILNNYKIESSLEKSQITLVTAITQVIFNKSGARYFRFHNENGIVDLSYPTTY